MSQTTALPKEEMMLRMIQRAKEADQIVSFLRNSINDLVSAKIKASHIEEIKALEKEQELLKQECNKLVEKLNILEGRPPSIIVRSPSLKTSPSENVAASPESDHKQTVEAKPKEEKASQKEIKKEKSPQTKDAEKKSGKEKGGKKSGEADEDKPVDVSRLDFRIGRILEAHKHPDADSLYVESIDVNEEKPRTVVSGLVKFVPVEEMQNRLVVLLCNLKPVKMRGVTSEAMVMCASTPEKVEILIPPETASPGDLVTFEGYPRNPDAQLNPKKKIFEQVAPFLKTNSDLIATYKDVPFNVENKGFIKTASLANVNIK